MVRHDLDGRFLQMVRREPVILRADHMQEIVPGASPETSQVGELLLCR